MTTIKEVADHAGVSPATVSRVMSGASRVQPAYRERVLRAVADLDYRPNRLASNLRRQATAMIGVVVSDIENPHFTRMVRAVEDAAFARGYRVLLCNTDEMPEKQRAYLEVLAAERVQGIVLVPSNPAPDGIGRDQPRCLEFDFELRVRRSCGTAAARETGRVQEREGAAS